MSRVPLKTVPPSAHRPCPFPPQQDNREKRAFGQGKAYSFLMRTRQPAGVVPNRLYLVMDDLADQVTDRATPTPALTSLADLVEASRAVSSNQRTIYITLV